MRCKEMWTCDRIRALQDKIKSKEEHLDFLVSELAKTKTELDELREDLKEEEK